MPRALLTLALLTGCGGETYDYVVTDLRVDGGWAEWYWEDSVVALFEVASTLPSQPTIGAQVSSAGNLMWGDRIDVGLWLTQGSAKQSGDGEVRVADGYLNREGLADWSSETKLALDGSFEATLPGEELVLGALVLSPDGDVKLSGNPSEDKLKGKLEFNLKKPTIKAMAEEEYWEAIADGLDDQESEDALGDAVLGLLGEAIFGSGEEPGEDPSLILSFEAERCEILE